MNAHAALHPTEQTLSSFALGKLDDASSEAVNTHLEQCPDCRKRVAEMSADSFLERVRGAQKPSGNSTFGQSRPGGTQSYSARNAPAPPPANTLPPGLADHPDYEIKRELGRGGMGVVYLAHNRLMGRDEVLKVMGQQIMERAGVPERFLREIRAVAKLRHPNIVMAYHATRIGESIVFAMEYVEGYDLAQLVKGQGPLPVALACNFVYQAALGLQHAHEEGLVHRDIKPGNLMLSRKGNKATVKVLDFGLAKATREEKVDGGLTSEGQALGTPDFIAPEQIVDAPSADIRADIYSLGGTLYYLLSGGPPFQANCLYDMYQAQISQNAAPLNLVRPEVPAELAALVAKMMAKDPARRFQTPGGVAQALMPFFKKADAVFKSPKLDVSQASRSSVGQPGRKALSTPAQPPTDAGGPAVWAKKVAEPTVPEAPWKSLIEFHEPESSIEATPQVAPARRPPWVWPSAAVGLLLFAFCAAWLGGVFKVKTPEGVIVLEGVPQDAEILVDGSKVTLAWPGSGKPLEIRAVPGDHKVEVKKDGFRVFGEIVRVTTDKSSEVTVRLEPPVVNRPAQEKQTEIRAKEEEEPKTAAVPVPRSDLGRIATGKWVRLVDSKTVLSDPQKMKFQNGILELDNTRMLFPKINARDVILRARVRKVSGLNVSIGLRCGAGRFLAAFFSGTDILEGDWFGIGRKIGGTWGDGDYSTYKDLAALHIGRKIQPDEFVEMAFAAIGDKLTLYVDGTKVTTVKNNEFAFASGFINIAALHGRGLFKDVECQILDSVPATATWTRLFNGKDLTGWESLENGSSWKVENGVLEGRGGGFRKPAVLISKRRDFKNFRLRAKVRYPDESFGWIELRRSTTAGGNNGYFVWHGVWPPQTGGAYPSGSVTKASDFHYGANLHFQVQPEPTSFGMNTWYTIEIALDKNVLTTSVDGKKLSTYTDVDESYKFGAIAMVCRGVSGPVQFQEIMIEEIPE